jgi:hypothetical protein
MKTIQASAAIAALISTSSAMKVHQKASPDVFGPNGNDYQNISPDYDMSRIGINFDKKGKGP